LACKKQAKILGSIRPDMDIADKFRELTKHYKWDKEEPLRKYFDSVDIVQKVKILKQIEEQNKKRRR